MDLTQLLVSPTVEIVELSNCGTNVPASFQWDFWQCMDSRIAFYFLILHVEFYFNFESYILTFSIENKEKHMLHTTINTVKTLPFSDLH